MAERFEPKPLPEPRNRSQLITNIHALHRNMLDTGVLGVSPVPYMLDHLERAAGDFRLDKSISNGREIRFFPESKSATPVRSVSFTGAVQIAAGGISQFVVESPDAQGVNHVRPEFAIMITGILPDSGYFRVDLTRFAIFDEPDPVDVIDVRNFSRLERQAMISTYIDKVDPAIIEMILRING